MTTFPATKTIGILVFEDFEPLDVWGFIEAFSIARFIGTGYADEPRPFAISLISNETRRRGGSDVPLPVRSFNGPRVAPDMFREDALSREFDVLMVPGGQGVDTLLTATTDAQHEQRDELYAWIRAMDERAGILASVCTGAAILAGAGVLDGQAATTNHRAFAWVTSFGPRVLWDNVSRWVDAGHHVTSAGVSAGTDMAFYLVARLAGRAVAEAAARSAEYDWQRDPEQPIAYPQRAAVPSKQPTPR
jgi:transcriptional regulator GlxA family with amidase domain